MCDSGPGIAPELLPRVFERYWQAQRGAHKGSGLGLYIAKGMVEAQAGTIWAESTPGQGASFYFALPARELAPAGVEVSSARPAAADAASCRAQALILIVDDDDELRETFRTVLERKGYRVAEAGNGHEAARFLTAVESFPALILLDLQMPVMDGRQFVGTLRADPALATIPVVLVSSQRDLEQQARVLGVSGYLEKPLEPARLIETVESHRACTTVASM